METQKVSASRHNQRAIRLALQSNFSFLFLSKFFLPNDGVAVCTKGVGRSVALGWQTKIILIEKPKIKSKETASVGNSVLFLTKDQMRS